MSKISDILLLLGLCLGGLTFLMLNILWGDVNISFDEAMTILSGGKGDEVYSSYIIENRLNRSITALLAGGALALSGLMLQVFFRNPLAGPGVLGVTSGASLGVATVILGGVSMTTLWGNVGIIMAGVAGAFLVLILLLILSFYIRNSVTLLVTGLMFGYFTSALINILYYQATESSTRSFVVWGLGSFDGLTNADLTVFSLIILLFSVLSFTLVKSLNALVTGAEAAISLGVNIKRTRLGIIIITGVLAAIVTVYCGPVGFVGIAVPQLMRSIIRSKNHAVILPLVFAGGALLGIVSDFVVRYAGNLPLNTVTALVGVPIIVWVIIKINKQNVTI